MDIVNLPNSIKKIQINIDHSEVGVLTHSARYQYTPTVASPFISLTMDTSDLKVIEHGSIHPIFAQNLPEGFNRRYIAEKLARYAKVNDMYLLALQADNGIGLLSYESELKLADPESMTLDEILNYSGRDNLFQTLIEKYYLRNSLAGVQPKVSLPNTVTGYTDRTVHQKDLIVKTYDEEYNLLTVNEYVCMKSAEYCGLNPPKTYLSQDLKTYVVERFDKNSAGEKLGYEDFTTLMKKGSDPNEKYNGSYENLLKATDLYTGSNIELTKIFKYIVFSCLIGNGDAHLKNFALMYDKNRSQIFVSPPFDITHTLIYPNLDDQMALKMRASKKFPNIDDLVKLADSGTYKVRNPLDIIETLAEGIMEALSKSDVVNEFKGLRQSIESNLSRVMTRTSIRKMYVHDRVTKHK